MRKIILVLMVGVSVCFSCSYLFAFAWRDDIIRIGEEVVIKGDESAKEVVCFFAPVTVHGYVKGNVIAVGGNIDLKPHATIEGDVITFGGDIFRDPGASIKGKAIKVYIPQFIRWLPFVGVGTIMAFWAALQLVSLIGFIGLTVLLIVLMPLQLSVMTERLMLRPFLCFCLGLLGVLLIVPILIFLIITIVGIILIPIYMVAMALIYLIGYVVTALFIGRKTMIAIGKKAHLFLEGLIGLLLIYMIGLIPFVGLFINTLLIIAGCGSVLITRFGIRAEA